MFRLLITDGTNKNSLAILRNLNFKTFKIDVLSSFPKYYSLCWYSKHINKLININTNPQEIDNYANELLQILRSGNYDFFIPVGLYSNLAASKFKNEICALVDCLIPDWNSMVVAANKELTMDHARRYNVPIPETWTLSNKNELNKIHEFPCIIKSSDGSKDYVKYCNNEQELLKNYSYLSSVSRTKIISQEIVKGFGCGFFGIYHNGHLVKYYLHKRIKEFPITGGPSAVAESFFDEELLIEGKKVCDPLNWNGPIMAEFKYSKYDNKYKLIELNPKLWGSLDLTIRAGINIPELIVSILSNNQIPSCNNYEDIRYRWVFPDEFKSLMSCLNMETMVDFFHKDKRTHTNLSLDDPIPTLVQIARGIYEGLIVFVNNERRFCHGYYDINKT